MLLNKCFITAFILSLLCLPMPLFAQDEAGQWEQLFDTFNVSVVTASQTAEPLKETPVPITVITKDQIEKMGARTLKDVLVTVPGFYFVQDHNEVNIASRGIYASSQQKFAILRDGHRLNTKSYQEADPDDHISLAAVDHIEILRGPGGSLYGDVALTGVVNIISQKADAGNYVKVGGGNYGQATGDIVYGKTFFENSEVLIYSHWYKSDGEEVDVDASDDFNSPGNTKNGKVVVGRFDDNPSYDVGINLKVNDTKFHASRAYSHYQSPRSDGGTTGAVYNIDDYRTFEGETVGLSTETFHSYIERTMAYGENNELTAQLYYDESKVDVHLISNPNTLSGMFVDWKDYTAGTKIYTTIPYVTARGQGNVQFGMQAEYAEVWDASYIYNYTPTTVTLSNQNKVLALGDETSYALFAQIKHPLTEKILFNGGARYDYLQRADDNKQKELSPRAALIYMPTETWDFKLSYTRSFEEAPYWYRYNTLPSYIGASSLDPETMDTIQLSTDFKTGQYLTHQITLFNQDLQDLVYRNTTVTPARYDNAGSVETQGIEYEVLFAQERYSIKFNYTFLDLVDATVYPNNGDQINNIPEHAGNLILDVNLLSTLWANLSVNYIGERPSPIGNSTTTTYSRHNLNHMEEDVTLLNMKLTWRDLLNGSIDLSASVKNVTDEEWYQGGSTILPYEQAGRWYMVECTYKWK